VLEIRAATEADHDAIWDIFHAIVAAGDTYAFELEMSRQEGLAFGFEPIRVLTLQKTMGALSALTS